MRAKHAALRRAHRGWIGLHPHMPEQRGLGAKIHIGAPPGDRIGRGADMIAEHFERQKLAPAAHDAHTLYGIVIVRRPDTVGARQNGQINPPTAA